MTLSNHVPIAGQRPQTRSQGPALRSGDSTEGLAEEQARRAVNRQTEGHANSVAPIQDRTSPPRGTMPWAHYAAPPHPRPERSLNPTRGTEAPRGLWPGLPPSCNPDLPPPLSRLQLPRGHHSGAGVGQRPPLSQPGARLLCEGLGESPRPVPPGAVLWPGRGPSAAPGSPPPLPRAPS